MSQSPESLIEIKPLVDINILKETLSRIGIANKKSHILYPTCYLYKNFDKHYVVHFKELFLLTRPNGYNNMSLSDIKRKNSIIYCLEGWNLIKILDKSLIEPHDEYVFVLPYKEKPFWTIEHKFNMTNIEILEWSYGRSWRRLLRYRRRRA